MSGQLLDAKRIVPASLWRYLGTKLCVVNPEIASLKAMYRRGRTLLEHQQMACNYLGVKRMREHHRRTLVRVLRDEGVPLFSVQKVTVGMRAMATGSTGRL